MFNTEICFLGKQTIKNNIFIPHSHNCYEVIYFLQGEGTASIGEKEYAVRPHKYSIVPPDTEHVELLEDDGEILFIGFHANQPWLKSVCWVLIHNENVNFSVKTVDGVKRHKKIGNIRNGVYNRLKISQSTGKLIVEFNGKKFEFDDPALISREPMHAFIGANTGNINSPAELKVDYMKVSGGAVASRLAARKLSDAESSITAKVGKSLELKGKTASFAVNFDGGLHWGGILHDGKAVSDPSVFVPLFAVSVDGNISYSNELIFERIEKNASDFKIFLKEKTSGVELCLSGKIILNPV